MKKMTLLFFAKVVWCLFISLVTVLRFFLRGIGFAMFAMNLTFVYCLDFFVTCLKTVIQCLNEITFSLLQFVFFVRFLAAL